MQWHKFWASRSPFFRYKMKGNVWFADTISGIACWLERRTRGRKVAGWNPGRSGGRIFFSTVNFACWLLFGVRSTPVLPQWYVKDPGHSAKSTGGRLRLNTHTPLTHRSRSGLTMPLSRQSVGIYLETSSHASRQGKLGHSRLSWTDSGLKSGIKFREIPLRIQYRNSCLPSIRRYTCLLPFSFSLHVSDFTHPPIIKRKTVENP